MSQSAPQAAPRHAVDVDVDIEDVAIRRDGDTVLMGRLFLPRGSGPFPAAVDVHGGAWVQGDRTGNDTINTRLAQRGIAVLAADHRLPPVGVHPAAVQDIHFAVRWLKANASRLGVAPQQVGLSGTSAGGHLAMLTALAPFDPRYAALTLDTPIDARVAFVVALWPVVCPYRRYQEVVLSAAANPFPDRPAGSTRQMAYWQTESAMKDGSPLEAVQRGDHIDTPPMLLVQSRTDPLHPIAHAEAFIKAYRERGGQADLHAVVGEPYYLVRQEPDSAAATAALDRMAGFIHTLHVQTAGRAA